MEHPEQLNNHLRMLLKHFKKKYNGITYKRIGS